MMDSYRDAFNSVSRPVRGVERYARIVALLVVLTVSGPALAAMDPVPQSPRGMDDLELREALKLYSEKRYEDSIVVFRSVLHKQSDGFLPAVYLARALTYAKRREEALSVLNQAAMKEKGKRRDLLNRQAGVISRLFLTNANFLIYQEGVNFLSAKKFKQARERFVRVLDQEPDNLEVLLRVGQCLVLEGDYDSAAERLRLARKLNSNESELHLWLGRALHQRGELMDALAELKIAKTELRGSELAPVWLAEALQSAGQKNAAIEVLEEDLKVQPFHVLALATLAKIKFTNLGRDPQAIWNIRRDLQVAMSRLEKYGSKSLPRFEGELGVELRSAEDVKTEIDDMLLRIDTKMQNSST